MARTIGGNPLKAAARRMGLPYGKSKPRPYTDADRKRLLAPIVVGVFGGKSHAGTTPDREAGDSMFKGNRHSNSRGRYGYHGDWADLDNLS